MATLWKCWHRLSEEEREQPALLTKALQNPKADCEHRNQIMFGTFNALVIYFATQIVRSWYSSGLTIVDPRDSISHTVPFYAG